MKKREAAAAAAQAEIEEMDPDAEETIDQQTMKDREWDNWKDDHERGIGNKGYM